MNIDVNGLEVLSQADALALLETREVGRLVYTRRALPAVMPVNYAVRDGAIWIWTGSASSLGQALSGAVVAFQVDDLDCSTHSGWSVTVTGIAEVVTDYSLLAWAHLIGPTPWASGLKEHLIRIPTTMVAGRWMGGEHRFIVQCSNLAAAGERPS
jgi:hypothetical protein